VNLPYFDAVLSQLAAGNQTIADALGRNVHWGYWAQPASQHVTSGEFQAAAERMNRELTGLLAPSAGDTVVDVGCGFGGTIASLCADHRDLSLVGVNIDPRQLLRARAEVGPLGPPRGHRIDLVCADGCSLPLATGRFDGMLAVECIFHFPSREQFLVEAYRVLRPGGRLVISDFLNDRKKLLGKLLLFLPSARSLRAVFGSGTLPWTVSKYRNIAARIGFVDVTARDITVHTIPTYGFLRQIAGELGSLGAPLSRTIQFMETAAQRGYTRYTILTLVKPGARSG